MKKLIISMVATASIALVAKADVLNGTSFEGYKGENGFQVGLDDLGLPNGNNYWTGGEDGLFDIKALTGDGGLGAKTVDRPKYWADVADANALAIDTDDALVRNINSDKSAMDIGNGLYFDSMVQFTATTDAPSVEANTSDKLVVWLKEIEGTEGQPSTYKLCVTAGVWDSLGHITVTEFENTNQEIAVSPDEWYRLSISVSADEDGYPLFEVRVNGKLFAARDVNKFMSLAYEAEDAKTITSVSFQGKGAIDDLVWTTEDPFVAPTKSYTVIVDDSIGSLIESAQYKIGEADEVSVSLYDGETDETADFALAVPVDATSVTFFLAPGDEYEVEGGTFVNDRWVVTVVLPEAGSEITLKIIEKQVVEPDPVKPFTVTIAGVDTPFETLSEAIAAAKGATIKLTETATLTKKLTVAEAAVIDLNGQTLTLANVQGYAVVVQGALTIKDSVGTGAISVPGFYGFGIGTFLEDVNVPGSLTVESGSIIGEKAEYLIGIFVGSATIKGGTFKASYCCLNAIGKYDAITGAEIDITCATATVTGGQFTVKETDTSVEWDVGAILGQDGCVAVSGGTFNVPLKESLCAKGYAPTTEAVNGYYTVEEKADDKPTAGDTELEADDFADVETVNSTTEVTLPEGWIVSEGKILDKTGAQFVAIPAHYTATVVNRVIKLELNDTVKPVIAAEEGKDALTIGDADVKLNVPNRNANLFYGVKAAATLEGLKAAAPAWAETRGANPPAVTKSGNAQFFKVVVTDVK